MKYNTIRRSLGFMYNGSFPQKELNLSFSGFQIFSYSRSLKCPVHIASYTLRIRVSVIEL